MFIIIIDYKNVTSTLHIKNPRNIILILRQNSLRVRQGDGTEMKTNSYSAPSTEEYVTSELIK